MFHETFYPYYMQLMLFVLVRELRSLIVVMSIIMMYSPSISYHACCEHPGNSCPVLVLEKRHLLLALKIITTLNGFPRH